ncbi:PIN domain-like protein [Phlegmacium glaucopus]|nr:PIN domain-like protein [Phlegmacium glaucopus]
MGIHNLWKILLPACQTRTFTQLLVAEGFESGRKDGCIHIGIDTSVWMNEAQMAIGCAKGPRTQAGENPVLQILFFHLCQLLALPVILIFVFDGNNWPSIKRGVKVKGKAHWLTGRLQHFIEAFGFHWYTAPGEAEADLAKLSSRNIIDGIVSSDGDTFVFVHIYTSDAIQSHAKTSLTCKGLFLLAILNRGDYDSVGLAGCGPTIVHKLAQSELAPSLFRAVSDLLREALSDFLADWRQTLNYPAVARNISSKFPSIDVLLRYACPVTSWMTDTIPDTSCWTFCQPDIMAIALLCEKSFSWGTSGQIVARFQQNVCAPDPNVDIKCYMDGSLSEGSFTHSGILHIYQVKLGPGSPSTGANINGYVIKISASTLICDTIVNLDDICHHLALNTPVQGCSVWIPAAILASALPLMVQWFHDKSTGKTGRVISPSYPPV